MTSQRNTQANLCCSYAFLHRQELSNLHLEETPAAAVAPAPTTPETQAAAPEDASSTQKRAL